MRACGSFCRISVERGEAVLAGHDQVQKGHIRVEGLVLTDGLDAVLRLADEFHAGLGLDQRTQPLPDDCMIVRNKDSDGFTF